MTTFPGCGGHWLVWPWVVQALMTNRQAFPLDKETQCYSAKVPCPCGCSVRGPLTKNGHVRGCGCRPCIGRRSRQGGLAKQRAARKKLGVPNARFHGQNGNEENWAGPFRVEVKSGAQTNPAATRYLKDEAQSESKRAIGDTRPFLDVLMPPGMTDGIVQLRVSTWRQVVEPALTEFWGEV